MPTLEAEIALLAARRDEVDGWLKKRMQDPACTTGEVLRYLAVLSQVGRNLATMLAQRAAGAGVTEIEGFFEAVALRVHELEPPSAPESGLPAADRRS